MEHTRRHRRLADGDQIYIIKYMYVYSCVLVAMAVSFARDFCLRVGSEHHHFRGSNRERYSDNEFTMKGCLPASPVSLLVYSYTSRFECILQN